MRLPSRFLLLVLAGLVCLSLSSCTPPIPREDDDFGPVGDFQFTERSGKKITQQDLLGKVWIASFVLTRCPDGKCPQVTLTVQRLQEELADRKDLQLVTFTVDPDHDEPAELSRYAEVFKADPDRWWFLTGSEEEIDRLMSASFHLVTAEKRPVFPSNIPHSQKLVVVDRQGRIRGYYDGLRVVSQDTEEDFEKNLRRLRRKVDSLLLKPIPAFLPRDIPQFNASLNACCVVLLLAGFVAIRKKMVRLHAGLMLSAIGVSALFLASYLYFHLVIKEGKATKFSEQAVGAPDWVQKIYMVVLLSHTILAILATPMALATAFLGVRGLIARHKKLARWTLPIWLYVSFTGVLVYWMLYRLYPGD